MTSPIIGALIGTGFTFFMTALGAGLVFFFKNEIKSNIQQNFLGFAGGVMVAASVWSLLIPSIEMSSELSFFSWVPAAGGLILGGAFLLLCDNLLPHLHPFSNEPEGIRSNLSRTIMLIFAVTLHNIPEGLAVGLTFGLATQNNEYISIASAATLALGMGLQNFPEGTAVSLPLKREGLSNKKSFLYGAASGIVEPIAGVIGVLLAGKLLNVLPWLLSFAAGAMLYVVVEELIPSMHSEKHSHSGTIGFMLGFLIMMILDVALA